MRLGDPSSELEQIGDGGLGEPPKLTAQRPVFPNDLRVGTCRSATAQLQWTARGLPIRDTADCQSALPVAAPRGAAVFQPRASAAPPWAGKPPHFITKHHPKHRPHPAQTEARLRTGIPRPKRRQSRRTPKATANGLALAQTRSVLGPSACWRCGLCRLRQPGQCPVGSAFFCESVGSSAGGLRIRDGQASLRRRRLWLETAEAPRAQSKVLLRFLCVVCVFCGLMGGAVSWDTGFDRPPKPTNQRPVLPMAIGPQAQTGALCCARHGCSSRPCSRLRSSVFWALGFVSDLGFGGSDLADHNIAPRWVTGAWVNRPERRQEWRHTQRRDSLAAFAPFAV